VRRVRTKPLGTDANTGVVGRPPSLVSVNISRQLTSKIPIQLVRSTRKSASLELHFHYRLRVLDVTRKVVSFARAKGRGLPRSTALWLS
jgi:hypothetical protein